MSKVNMDENEWALMSIEEHWTSEIQQLHLVVADCWPLGGFWRIRSGLLPPGSLLPSRDPTCPLHGAHPPVRRTAMSSIP